MGPDHLDGHGALHHLMFGEIHFAHATRPDELRETILSKLPRLKGLASQASDRANAPNPGHGRKTHDQYYAHPAVPCEHTRQRCRRKYSDEVRNDWHGRQHADHYSGAPPGVGDVHRVNEDQHDPRQAGTLGEANLSGDLAFCSAATAGGQRIEAACRQFLERGRQVVKLDSCFRPMQCRHPHDSRGQEVDGRQTKNHKLKRSQLFCAHGAAAA